jgi:hypothetical protein
VAYLNGSKVLTTGSALTFDGSNFGVGVASPSAKLQLGNSVGSAGAANQIRLYESSGSIFGFGVSAGALDYRSDAHVFYTTAASPSEQMRLTSTGLGIGTSSPTTKLEVALAAVTPSNTSVHGLIVGPDSGTTSVGQGAGIGFKVRNTAGGAVGGNNLGAAIYGIQDNTGTNTGALAFYTRSDASTFSERMRLNFLGDLGFGVTPPTLGYGRQFTISQGSGTANPSLAHQAVNTNDERIYLTNNMAFATSGFSNSYTYIKTGASATYYVQKGGSHEWYTAPSGTAGNAITFTQAMTLDASGRLGVGRVPTTYGLEVAGGINAAFSSGNRTGVVLTGDATNGRVVMIAGDNSERASLRCNDLGGPSDLLFFTNNSSATPTERMRLDSSGNLLVGQTSTTASLGKSVQITNGSSLGQYAAGPGSSAQTYTFGRDNVSTGNFVFAYNGAVISSISPSTGIYTPLSDIRVKKNVMPLQYGLNEILQLSPVIYNMASEKDSDKKHIGLIAQQVKSVLDEAVDDLIDPEKQMYGLDKSVLVPVLVKAMQEQQALIQTLTARVASLESN